MILSEKFHLMSLKVVHLAKAYLGIEEGMEK